MLSVQSKPPSLAGLLNIPQSQGCNPCRQHPKHFGDNHSAKESAQCCGSEHRLNIRPMFESYIAGIPAFTQVQNSDLYGDPLLSFETTTRGREFLESIKKRSINKCFGQKADKKKGSISNATLSTTANGYQPFGSIPKRSSSLRPSVLSQLPRLIFSAAAAVSNCALSSGDKRTLNIGERPEPLGTLSLSMIDMYRPIALSLIPLGLYHSILGLYKETPPNSITSTERGLTTTVIYSNEEAMQENTTPAQGRHSLNLKTGNEQQSFIWIIAAVRRDCPTIKATIHHIAAPTEREARQSLVKEHVCFFAGRINQGVAHA